MNADCFTYTSEPYYQENIFNLLGYAQSEIKKIRSKTKFSRADILAKHIVKKGKAGSKTKLELEDYLRNDLVQNYLTIYKTKFNLDHLYFIPGADEINDGVTTGSLDIKVIFPNKSLLSGEEYLAIECKRINKLLDKKRYYIDEGVNRFITRQYYPEADTKVAFMLSFMECEKDSQKQYPIDIVKDFNTLLQEAYEKNVIDNIGEKDLNMDIDPTLEVFNSLIKRIDSTELIVYHVFLDYYDIIDS
ncbi:hypothetical protein D1818_02135 [Aquimarina sp. BL5]|uniref:hypothetical protein n=1 Tax=Aquimarina sp. BL5 TaxID=1714860 RepID=UPI000E4AB76C|nr:hypothetical protein [Aquimarina sp. BL5]AXT49677.1 hypothetical protein D1818_02135 [Aquimarina sp. BL5]RKN00476.1 hypothetical protein D7036_18705 [Aquimarina sp. BL5]